MKKAMGLLGALLFTHLAMGEILPLDSFDQAKLGEFLIRLPKQMTEKSKENNFSKNLQILTLKFPRTTEAFAIKCSLHFYQDSPYPSETHCEVTVNKQHPRAILRHDVVRVTVQDPAMVKGIYQAIPYGALQRKLYSYDRDPGVTFQGIKGSIHHYQIICATSTCWFKFSNKILVD